MKKRKTIIVVLLIVVLLVFTAGCFSSTEETVKVGKEEFATLYSIVGEKKITGSSVSSGTDGSKTELTYTDVSLDELNDYITELVAQDAFMITEQAQTDGIGQTYQLGKQASEAGKIMLINFYFVDGGETVITYIVGQGEITPEE